MKYFIKTLRLNEQSTGYCNSIRPLRVRQKGFTWICFFILSVAWVGWSQTVGATVTASDPVWIPNDAIMSLHQVTTGFSTASSSAAQDPNSMTLAGQWQIRMDQPSIGIDKKWFQETFSGDPATLPGTVATNPRQAPVTSRENALQGGKHDVSEVYPYAGGVWYQREVDIPQGWESKHITLFLERCQWQTFVWLDDQYIGTRNSLVAPHVYQFPGNLKPGNHRITILVDNANRKGQAVVQSQDATKFTDLSVEVRSEAKLNCGGHHMLWGMGHKWNGILGRLELKAVAAQHLISLDVYPQIADGAIEIKSRVANQSSLKSENRLRVTCRPLKERVSGRSVTKEFSWELSGADEQNFGNRLTLKAPVDLWNEFSPELYLLSAELIDDKGTLLDRKEVRFGMRELGRKETQFTINGQTTFMRGILNCFNFPLTGYPPVDVESWRRIISIAKSYGMNLMRFHSCTPPEAAFQAADELGFYFQVEVPGTSCPVSEESKEVEDYLFEELKRMLHTYGNHPSLLFVSMGNEQLIVDHNSEFYIAHKKALMRKVAWGQKEDPRHFYTCTSHPYDFTNDRNDDFYISQWGIDFKPLAGICAWRGGARLIDAPRFNTVEPNTTFDYRDAIEGMKRPVMSHEIGQWAVYPDLREISRYHHGATRVFNFEIIRDDLREKGLLEFANDFTRASGKLSLELYREEIESALRTPNMGGFQMLDLQDFPGQGTSTIGILNSLGESKGLITPAQFKSFCGPVVALARLPKRVWNNTESFTASIELANYGPTDLKNNTTIWRLEDSLGHIYVQGKLESSAPQGGLSTIGQIAADLSSVLKATNLRLYVEMVGVTANSWDIWVYPAEESLSPAVGITLARELTPSLLADLKAGGTVLLCPLAEDLTDGVPGTFTTAFWNTVMKHEQVSKTMGILCDPAHPALADFPTEYYSNWQWWDLVKRSSAVCLDELPEELRPIVGIVDNFAMNRRLAMIFDARVGSGRLLFCATDIISDLEIRPAARQLRKSLLKYMASPLFYPDVDLSVGDLEKTINVKGR